MESNPKQPADRNSIQVTLLGSMPPQRGISAYCQGLTDALSKRLAVHVLSFHEMYPRFLYPGGSTTDDSTTVPDTKRLTIERRLRWYNPLGWIKSGCRASGDVLHAQWWSLPLAPVYIVICAGFRARGKPIVVTVHNITAHEPSPWFRMASKLLFSLADCLIVHTEGNRETLYREFGVPRHRIRVLPHGPLMFSGDIKTDSENSKQRFGFRPEHKIILFFGAIRHYKGLDVLISAFGRVLRDVPDARLLIAGNLWENQNRYEKQIRQLGLSNYVCMHAQYIPSHRVHRYFHAADLVVLPYRRFPSQSGVGAASVAFRKPMIVTRVGGLPNLVRSSDCIVPPDDADALARRIAEFLKDNKKLMDLSEDADAIAKSISWPVIAESTVAIYRRLIQEKSDRPA